MTTPELPMNQVRQRRLSRGLTQAELAERAGISRSAVTAIEGNRLVPSVAAALSLSQVLKATVEEIFGDSSQTNVPEVWAWKPVSNNTPYWEAEVRGKTVRYPASSIAMLSMIPDEMFASACDNPEDGRLRLGVKRAATETLVMACCDPAAGLLASQFAAVTGMRLIIIPRSSRQAVELLRDGLVHLAGLHLSTADHPERNTQTVRDQLGEGFQLVRLAHWESGITFKSISGIRSVRGAMNAKLTWVGREAGSGARQCLDQLFGSRPSPRRVASDHRGVVEAVHSGWAEAGVCVRLTSEEAGQSFLPVQTEAMDVCFSDFMATDRRIKAFINIVRSNAYRKILGSLPGYDTRETGNLWSCN